MTKPTPSYYPDELAAFYLENTNETHLPSCPECGRQMQFNNAASNDAVKQYICGCNGRLKFENIHLGQRRRDGN